MRTYILMRLPWPLQVDVWWNKKVVVSLLANEGNLVSTYLFERMLLFSVYKIGKIFKVRE